MNKLPHLLIIITIITISFLSKMIMTIREETMRYQLGLIWVLLEMVALMGLSNCP
jgi:hypothetical protein